MWYKGSRTKTTALFGEILGSQYNKNYIGSRWFEVFLDLPTGWGATVVCRQVPDCVKRLCERQTTNKPNPIVCNPEHLFNRQPCLRTQENEYVHQRDSRWQGTWTHYVDCSTWMHIWRQKKQDETGQQIRRKYDTGKTEVVNSRAEKELFRHYATTGKCRFGDDYKYDHPSWVKIKFDKKKKSKKRVKWNRKKVKSQRSLLRINESWFRWIHSWFFWKGTIFK